MGRFRTGALAGAALTAGLALGPDAVGAANGDRLGAVTWDHTFTRDGQQVTCTIHGRVTYNPDAREARAFVEVRDDDDGCRADVVGGLLAYSTQGGDLVQATSTGPGPWVEVIASEVASTPWTEVWATFPCGPGGSDRCDTTRHLEPK